MADYYISTCFPLNASLEEIDVLREMDAYDEDADGSACEPSAAFLRIFPPTDADQLSGYRKFLQEIDQYHWADFSDCIKQYENGIFYENYEMNLDYVSQVLRRVCKSALPITYTWAGTCSSLRPDAFYGGFVKIEEEKIRGYSACDLLEKERELFH